MARERHLVSSNASRKLSTGRADDVTDANFSRKNFALAQRELARLPGSFRRMTCSVNLRAVCVGK